MNDLKPEAGLRPLNPNKSLGQNFIYDENILKKIASTQEGGSVCLEIGVGPGGLTKHLAGICKKVIGVEIDRKFESLYEKTQLGDNVSIIFEDFMKTDMDGLYREYIGEPFGTCANLPYYITTPIMMKLLESNLPITNITVLVQKEVAEKIAARPGSKRYGVLSVLAQCRGDVKKLFDLQPGAFSPPPNVISSLVQIKFSENKIRSDINDFTRCVKTAFSSRRKQVKANLVAHYNITKQRASEILGGINVADTARAEELSAMDFDNLTGKLMDIKNE